MGTTTIFTTLSERPEYNSKIQLVICLGPVTGFVNKPYTELSPVPISIFILVNIFTHEFLNYILLIFSYNIPFVYHIIITSF